MSTFWTMKDEDGYYYDDEFKHFGVDKPVLTDEDAKKANMDRETIKEFFDDGFKQVRVKIIDYNRYRTMLESLIRYSGRE